MSAKRWVLEIQGVGVVATLPGSTPKHEVRRVAMAIATSRRRAVVVKRISASSSSSRATSRRKKPRRAARASSSSKRRSKKGGRRRAKKASKKGPRKSRPRGRGRARAKRNPVAAATLRRAERTFGMWHQFEASDVRRVKNAHQLPPVVVLLGELVDVTYASDKWTGRRELYRHTFDKKNRPLLCTSPDARGLFVVGGRAKVTERGIVN